MSTQNFKLTQYPIGSIREIWRISYPLMLSYLSVTTMLFFDRLFLAHYSLDALAACANAGLASYIFMVLPMMIGAIAEVYVGQYHGAGEKKEMGGPVWQMLWFCLLITPFFWFAASYIPPILFHGTGNEVYETTYFSTVMWFGPIFCAVPVLSGFFIGKGQVFIVTWAMLLGNIVNIMLDGVLIFGWGPIPSLGVYGAAVATVAAQISEVIFLFWLFLRKENREQCGTTRWHFDRETFFDCIRIGAPNGLGHTSEMLAHFAFFRIMIHAGGYAMTIATITQTLYILFAFTTEGLSKGVTAVVSNLIGGEQWQLIGKVLRSALTLLFVCFPLLLALFIFYPTGILHLFLSSREQALIADPHFLELATRCCLWMSLFFLFDGICWVLIGLLTAAGDTKFILFVSSLFVWPCYVLPVYVAIKYYGATVDSAWMMIAIYSLIAASIYFWRFRSERWRTVLIPSTGAQPGLVA